MDETGWIKTYRSFRNSWMWTVNEPFDKRSAWVDMLMSAFYTDGEQSFRGKKIAVKRGQFPTSTRILADRWMWGATKVNRYIERLKAEQMINTERIDGGTLVTIINYGFFQGEWNSERNSSGTVSGTETEQQSEQGRNSERNSSGTAAEHIKRNKEYKNIRNEEVRRKEEKKTYYPEDALLETAFQEFLTMRNKIKKPLCTSSGIHRAMNMLEKLSGGDNDLAIKILNQSVDHCWQGLFALKDEDGGTKPKSLYDEWRES